MAITEVNNGSDGAAVEPRLRDDSKFKAHNLVMKFSVSMALKAVLNLGIPDILAAAEGKRALSAAEILSQLPTKSSTGYNSSINLRRIITPLVREGFFSESLNGNKESVFDLTQVSKWFIKGSEMNMLSIADLNLNPVTFATWTNLHEVILDESCTPFDKAHGLPMHEYISKKDPEYGTQLEGSRVSYSRWQLRDLLDDLRQCSVLDGVTTLVDLGGSTGTIIDEIVAHEPHIQGVNSDLPHVIARAPSIKGVQHVAGNFFEDLPSGDAILLKNILQNYGDEDTIKIHQNCFKALSKNGKIILAEYVQNEHDQSAEAIFVNDLDLSMLQCLKGARERTKDEYEGLLKVDGFPSSTVDQNPGSLALIVAFKM